MKKRKRTLRRLLTIGSYSIWRYRYGYKTVRYNKEKVAVETKYFSSTIEALRYVRQQYQDKLLKKKSRRTKKSIKTVIPALNKLERQLKRMDRKFVASLKEHKTVSKIDQYYEDKAQLPELEKENEKLRIKCKRLRKKLKEIERDSHIKSLSAKKEIVGNSKSRDKKRKKKRKKKDRKRVE